MPQHDSSCAKALAGNRADESRMFRRGRNSPSLDSVFCSSYSSGRNEASTITLLLAELRNSPGCTN